MWGARAQVGALAVLWLVIGGCGGGSAKPDAGVANQADSAPVCTQMLCGADCVDLSSNPDHCGSCDKACTPAADCKTSACACPTIAITANGFVLSQMDDQMLAPTVLGIGVFSDSSTLDAVVVGFDSNTPIGTDIDLAAAGTGPPFVGLGYDVNVTTRAYRSVYNATSGTLHLTRACTAGVAGTITSASFVEADADTRAPLTDGCTASIDSLTFDYGQACP